MLVDKVALVVILAVPSLTLNAPVKELETLSKVSIAFPDLITVPVPLITLLVLSA